MVDIFTNISLVDYKDKKDVLGRTYEYCLAMFAEQEGRRAGESYTLFSVVRTLVEILEPYGGWVYERKFIKTKVGSREYNNLIEYL